MDYEKEKLENLESENVIEWVTGDNTITLTISQRKFVTKIKRLAEKHPDKVQILAENKNGSLLAKLPIGALKLNIVEREMTEEQKEAGRERLAKYRESQKGE